MNLPNLITAMRIALVPAVLWAILVDRSGLALTLFLIAGISDAVDGFLAKQFSWHTELGAYLDPIADKLLLTGSYLVLGWISALPWWIVWIVVGRDMLIVAAVAATFFLGSPILARPSLAGKLSTVFQVGLVTVVLAHGAFGFDLAMLTRAGIWAVAVLAFWSALTYLPGWYGHVGAPPIAPKSVRSRSKAVVNMDAKGS